MANDASTCKTRARVSESTRHTGAITSAFDPQCVTVIERRNFLKIALAGGALLIAAPIKPARADNASSGGGDFIGDIGPYLRINPDNSLIIGAPSPEIGTGMLTTLPMLIAEELGANFELVEVRQMPVALVADEDGQLSWTYGVQGGGGSFTTRRNWQPVRRLAALTRRVLLQAGADRLGAPIDELHTENSEIVHAGSERRLRFSDVAARAAELPFPETESNGDEYLKDEEDYSLLGVWTRHKGVEDVVTGRAEFGLDASYPGMLYAVMERAPSIDGDFTSVNDGVARALPGVRGIIRLPKPPPDQNYGYGYLSAGVAVVADDLWTALKARRLLSIEWDPGPGAGEDTAILAASMTTALDAPGADIVHDGEADAALSRADATIDAYFDLPALAHATMEPMNAIVHWRQDRIDVVAPGHSCGNVVTALAQYYDLSANSIHMKSTRTGGSFGRRLYADAVVEAAEISRLAGAPIKLVWTREDDMTHDRYRPMSRHRVTAGLDREGRISGWRHRAALAFERPERGRDMSTAHMNINWPDNFPRRLVADFAAEFHHQPWHIPYGAWRAPMPTQHAFIVESMVNELAEAAGADPLDYRLDLLGEARNMPYDHWGGPTYNTGRLAACLRKAAQEADWERPISSGHGRGIAGYFTFGSYCAMVVDVAVSDRGALTVSRVTAAADAGLILNPNGFKTQIEGGIMDGLSTALRLEINMRDGGAVESNFDTYRIMRIADAPPIVDVHLLHGADEVHGTGEIGIPPLAPALVAAIYQATGKRIRRLPIADQLLA